jgi:hypothetical protein
MVEKARIIDNIPSPQIPDNYRYKRLNGEGSGEGHILNPPPAPPYDIDYQNYISLKGGEIYTERLFFLIYMNPYGVRLVRTSYCPAVIQS